jgi:hypothetical protein
VWVAAATIAALAAAPAGAQMYNQCPPAGVDTGCQFLITLTNQGNSVANDPSQGPYESSEDAMVGVLNNTSQAIASLPLSSSSNIFGFEADGICDNGTATFPQGCQPVPGSPAGTTCASPQGLQCSFPPPPGEPANYVEPGGAGALAWPNGDKQNGYEGPTTWFSNVQNGGTAGTVNFSPALQPGQSTYFSLEEPPTTAGGLQAGTPTPANPPPQQPTTPTAPKVSGSLALPLPSAKKCLSRRAFPIKVRQFKGLSYSFAYVAVNGKTVPVFVYRSRRIRVTRIGAVYLNTKRFRAFVDLRGLGKGTYKVRVSAVTKDGQLLASSRTYRTCSRKLAGSIPRL